MSNHLAIATVSASLQAIVDTVAKAALPGGASVQVSTIRPDHIVADNGQAGASIFLYQVAPNPSWRNEDLATRRRDGSLLQRPQTALDLYYLLTFFGDELTQLPERLAGAVTSHLHAEPVLARQRVQAVIAANGHLAGSDLDQQAELVRFTPLSLNLEELSKLWSVFFQTAYRLSVAYMASVVLIEPESAPQPSLPVARGLVYVDPLAIPHLAAAEGEAGPASPLLPGGTLVLRGRNLRGETTLVRLGDALATPAEADISGQRIALALTDPPFAADTLRAGVLPVQVLHQRLLGPAGQETPHRGLESNVLPLIFRPVIRPNGAGTGPEVVQGVDGDGIAVLTVTVDPQVGEDQRAVLLLNGSGASVRSYSLKARPRSAPANALVFAITDVVPAAYRLRIQVDGADSLLTRDTQGQYDGPAFTVTP
jgi:hypothetical protein